MKFNLIKISSYFFPPGEEIINEPPLIAATTNGIRKCNEKNRVNVGPPTAKPLHPYN